MDSYFGGDMYFNDMEIVKSYPVNEGTVSLMTPGNVEKNCYLKTANNNFTFQYNSKFLDDNIQNMSAKIGDYSVYLVPCDYVVWINNERTIANGVLSVIESKYHSLLFACESKFADTYDEKLIHGVVNADRDYYLCANIVGDMVKINPSSPNCENSCSHFVELEVFRKVQDMVKNLMAIMETSNYRM
jgi:hypothetical protein